MRQLAFEQKPGIRVEGYLAGRPLEGERERMVARFLWETVLLGVRERV